jgi:3-hydroxybutyrate dehydrogenase
MKSKRVFITGASGGIGKGIAAHLAVDHQVTISDCSEAAVLAAQADLATRGLVVEAQVFDVCNQSHLDQLRTQADSQRVDVLINNAGMQHVQAIEDFPPEKWQQLIDIMLVGPAMTTRAVLPAMRKHNYGRIINVGSVHSLVASAYKSAYVAAKHGLIGLAKTVALEVKEADITINTLCPGYVDTAMVRDQIKQQAQAHQIPETEVVEKIMLKNMPKKQFIAIEELAGTVAFLIGPYAKSITAQAITLDGGWTAH